MLNDQEFLLWFREQSLPYRARLVIDQIRASEPSRRVRSSAGNVCGFYPSRKMGRVIQFESHRNELAIILEYEHNKSIYELCGQSRYVAQAYIPSLKSSPQRIPTPHKFV